MAADIPVTTPSADPDGAYHLRLYVAGQDFTLSARDARKLAAADTIDGRTYAALSQRARDAVFELLGAGHFQLATQEDA